MLTPDLQTAIALYKQGDKDEARRRVAALCKANPDNADAWYVAAMMADGEGRARLLERALAVDPQHPKAAAALGRGEPLARLTTAPPKSPILTYALIGIVALLLVGLIAFGITRFSSNNAAVQPTPSPAPIISETSAPIATPLPSATNAVISTSTPAPTQGSSATPAPFALTATAYRHVAQTAQADLYATATSAALTFVPAGN
jgi:hypothetical protein